MNVNTHEKCNSIDSNIHVIVIIHQASPAASQSEIAYVIYTIISKIKPTDPTNKLMRVANPAFQHTQNSHADNVSSKNDAVVCV